MDEHDELELPTSTSDSETQSSSSQVGLAASRQASRAGVRTSDATPPYSPEQAETVGSDDASSGIRFDVPATDAFDRLADQPNVLLVGPAASAVACGRSVRQSITESTATNQLLVCIETPFEAQLDILRTYRTDVTEQRVVITAPSHDRVHAIEMSERQVDVLNVESPTDLHRLGTVMANLLTKRTDAPWNVSVHSLSSLLEAVDDDQCVFRFLHALTAQIRAANAYAQYYLDPTRHDEQTIRTFASLFDAVLEFDADGSVWYR